MGKQLPFVVRVVASGSVGVSFDGNPDGSPGAVTYVNDDDDDEDGDEDGLVRAASNCLASS